MEENQFVMYDSFRNELKDGSGTATLSLEDGQQYQFLPFRIVKDMTSDSDTYLDVHPNAQMNIIFHRTMVPYKVIVHAPTSMAGRTASIRLNNISGDASKTANVTIGGDGKGSQTLSLYQDDEYTIDTQDFSGYGHSDNGDIVPSNDTNTKTDIYYAKTNFHHLDDKNGMENRFSSRVYKIDDGRLAAITEGGLSIGTMVNGSYVFKNASSSKSVSG